MIRKSSGLSFIVPGIVIVATMTQVPFILTIIFSFLRWNLARPDLPRIFVGLNNYFHFLRIESFADIPNFYFIVFQTVIMTGTTLLICSVLGFLLALLLDNEIPGVNIARALILAPFFVMATAAGVVWRATIFNTTFGWYGVVARALNLPRVDLLSHRPMGVVILLIVWQWLPFFVLVILGGLQGLSDDIIESSKIDGCNWFQTTFRIKRPLIQNHMNVAIMLGLVFVIKEFGLILTTTGGGPGTRSYNLPYLVYMEVFNASQIGRAAAVSVITVVLTLTMVNLLYGSIKKRRDILG